MNIPLSCLMCVHNPLRIKYFHEALAGNVHACLLKPRIGKARVFSSRPLQEVLDLVLDTALDLSCAQYGSLRWVNRRKNALELKAIRVASGTRTPTAKSSRDLVLTDDSIMAEVVRAKQPLRIPDLSTEEWKHRYYPIDEQTPMRSELAVPLFSNDGNVVVGVLNVESRDPNTFTQADQECLGALAQRAQMVVQRVSLSEALENLSQKVLSMAPDDLLAYTVEALADLLHVHVCSIWLTDDTTDQLLLKQAIGRPMQGPRTPDVRIPKDGFLGRALNGDSPLYSPDVRHEPDFLYSRVVPQ